MEFLSVSPKDLQSNARDFVMQMETSPNNPLVTEFFIQLLFRQVTYMLEKTSDVDEMHIAAARIVLLHLAEMSISNENRRQFFSAVFLTVAAKGDNNLDEYMKSFLKNFIPYDNFADFTNVLPNPAHRLQTVTHKIQGCCLLDV